MERNNSMDDHHHHDDPSSPHSWWSNSHTRAPHSQWLQSTLSELDSKIKMILNVIEDDGDTFAQRAEMYYRKRPQLIEMVKDLQRSYSALADRYDQLKSESSIKAISYNDSLSNSSNSLVKRATPIKAKRLMNPRNATNYENMESPSCVIGFEDRSVADFSDGSSIEFFSGDRYRKPTGDDLVVEAKDRNVDEDKNSHGVMMSEGFWDEQMKFSKLLEENLSQQAELIKRNEENMELINQLRKENKALLSQTQRPCRNGGDGNNGTSSCHHHRNKMIGGGPFKGKEEPHRRKFRGFLCMP